jgi:hypothetical protein
MAERVSRPERECQEVWALSWMPQTKTWCSNMHLECPPKVHVLKDGSLGWWYWEVVEPLRVGHPWLMPVILEEAEIRRISIQSQPRQIVLKTLF